MKYFTFPILLAIVLLQGCSSTQTWYKTGGTQREFDLDSKECSIVAEQQALLRSETGIRYNPVDYSQLYQRCIIARGWGTEPLAGDGAGPASVQISSLGSLTGNAMTAFGRRFDLPSGSILLQNNRQAIGPTRMESFLFQNGNSYLNIIIQDSDEASFQEISYPVDPYNLYTTGRKNDIRWSAFWGKIGADWVTGLGSYIRFSRHQRCIIIVTAPLSPPAAPPPDRLRLAENQHLEIQDFLSQWRPWLEQQSRPGSPVWQAVRTTLGLFKSF